MSDLIFSKDSEIAINAGSGVLFTTGDIPKKGKTVVTPERDGSSKVMPWGESNDFPQQLATDVRKSTIIPSTLDKIARMIYQGGLMWGYIEHGDNGTEKFVPKMDKPSKDPVRQWMRRSNFERCLMQVALNFVWYRNAFVELILTPDRSKIARVVCHQSKNCRYEWPNEKTGLIENVYISANWPDSDEKRANKVPVLDPSFDPLYSLQNRTDGFNYIFPLSYPDVDNDYYFLADWNSARTSKWLSFSLKIPEFKEALMKHQMSIKYHFQFSADFWDFLYPKWGEMSDPEQKKAKEETLKQYDEKLAGAVNAGKSIFSILNFDNGKPIPGVTITAIEDKIKDGVYIEDSNEASSHILNAMGIDPTLVGNGPGKNFGSGSGSDKRVAFNIMTACLRVFQDLTLQWAGLVRDYNAFDLDLVFRYRTSLVSTLDSGKETKSE